MTKDDAIRVAAFIDGEGCLSRKKWWRKDGTLVVIPTIWITNTAVRLIEWFHDLLGGSVSTVEQDSKWKLAHRWYLAGLDALNLVKRCAAWFIIKVAQARWFVRYRLGRKLTRRDYTFNWRISERIRKLNKRGRHGEGDE